MYKQKKGYILSGALSLILVLSLFPFGGRVASASCPLTPLEPYRAPSSPQVYYITQNCTRQSISNPDIYFSHFTSWDDVHVVTVNALKQIATDTQVLLPWGPRRFYQNGTLMKTPESTRVYLRVREKLFPIGNEQTFRDLALRWQDVELVANDVIAGMTPLIQPTLDTHDHVPEGFVFKYADSPRIYALRRENGRVVKEHVTSYEYLTTRYRIDRIAILPTTRVFPDPVNSAAQPILSQPDPTLPIAFSPSSSLTPEERGEQTVLSPRPFPPTPRKIKLLVGLFESGTPNAVPLRREDIEAVVFGETNSVKRYFAENSYGLFSLEGEIVGPVPPPVPGNNRFLDRLDPYIDVHAYEYYLFISDEAGPCTGAGSLGKGTLFTNASGNVAAATANVTAGCITTFHDTTTSAVLLHELGHTFGLRHAGSWIPLPSCGATIPLSMPVSQDCFGLYSGGTVMGTTHADLDIYHRNILASPYAGPVREITTKGDYWVRWFKDNPGQRYYEELRVPAGNGYYSIEFRRNISPHIDKVVSINFVPANRAAFFPIPVGYGDGQLPDALQALAPAFWLNGPLPSQNFTFTDELRNISVTILKMEESRALVHISL